MRYQAILFDLDGTLLDTLGDIGDAVNRVLIKRDYPTHPTPAFRYFIGDGAEMLIRRALPEGERSQSNVERCLAAFLEDYAQNWNIKTRPYHGIPEMLNELANLGLKMAILSNKPHPMVVRCVEAFFKQWRFQAVQGHSGQYPKKPDPSGALTIAQQMTVNPGDILYLGDSKTDMETATAAMMIPIGAAWGFRPAGELLQSGCRFLAQNPLDVLNYVKL